MNSTYAFELDTQIMKIDSHWGKASICISFAGGGFKVSQIMIMNNNGKWVIKMPLVTIGIDKHPAITIQGALKQAVILAIQEDHQKLMSSNETTIRSSRYYDANFVLHKGSIA